MNFISFSLSNYWIFENWLLYYLSLSFLMVVYNLSIWVIERFGLLSAAPFFNNFGYDVRDRINDFFWLVFPKSMALMLSSYATGSIFFDSVFNKGLSFEDFILLVLPIAYFFYCPDPNIFIFMGWKSNWSILNTTSATNVFLSDGTNVISMFSVPLAAIVPLMGVIINAGDYWM